MFCPAQDSAAGSSIAASASAQRSACSAASASVSEAGSFISRLLCGFWDGADGSIKRAMKGEARRVSRCLSRAVSCIHAKEHLQKSKRGQGPGTEGPHESSQALILREDKGTGGTSPNLHKPTKLAKQAKEGQTPFSIKSIYTQTLMYWRTPWTLVKTCVSGE